MDTNLQVIYDNAPMHDPLTGLLNYYGFIKLAQRRIDQRPHHYSIIVTNLKDFNLVNQIYGNHVADHILIAFGQALRKIATVDKSIVYGRISADHFVVLYPTNLFQKDRIREFADQFTKSSDALEIMNVHFQFGRYDFKGSHDSVAVGCDKAFFALRSIKRQGIVEFGNYSDHDLDVTLRMKNILSMMNIALKKKEFKMYLQPQVDIQGNLVSAEALVRWQTPFGMLMPYEFISILEKAHRIHEVDYLIWKQAVETLARWQHTPLASISISVNVSPLDFHYFDLYDVFTSLCEEAHVPTNKLNIEITEQCMMDNLHEVIPLINRLKQAGFTTEIDDFGSGYSSLNLLRELPADMIKLDREFINTVTIDQAAKTVLRNTCHMINELGHGIICEGIEQIEQAIYLKSIGCHIFQGYYYSKPIPLDEFEHKYHLQTSA